MVALSTELQNNLAVAAHLAHVSYAGRRDAGGRVIPRYRITMASALDEENRSTDRLVDQLQRIESEEPDIAELLQQIFQRQATQRRSIQDMLMRSDPFAQSLA
jgi:hypothetical protein